jgi:hypothetical protein
MTDSHTETWHAGPELLREYAARRLDPAGQAAVESHLERCPQCRGEATALVTPAVLAPVWDRVLLEVRTPERAWPSRALRRLGIPEVDLVALRMSTNLVLALAVSTAATLGFALAASSLSPARQTAAWLAIAPLLPALLVAGAYDSTDPLREVADSTPSGKLRIALLRTLVAVLGALPLVVVMTFVPNIDASVAAWLLPALAISLVLLVLLTRLSAVVAVGAVAAGWLLVVATLSAGSRTEAVGTPLGQSCSLLLAVAAALALVHRLSAPQPDGGRR